MHKHLLSILFLLLLLSLFSKTFQQTCSSPFIHESESTQGEKFIECPIGYVNNGTSCVKFSKLFHDKREGTCASDSDCLFSSLKCLSGKCISKFKLTGDACLVDEQCLQIEKSAGSSYDSGIEPFRGVQCIKNVCAFTRLENVKKIGELCVFDSVNKTNYLCESGLTCLNTNSQPCVPVIKAKKGESCRNEKKGDVFDKFIICEEVYFCNKSNVCVDPLEEHEKCLKSNFELDFIPCRDGLICRQKSGQDPQVNTCQMPAVINGYCAIDNDCANFNTDSELVGCLDNKCKRYYGTQIGDSCKANSECYNSYCKDGKCTETPTVQCSDSEICPTGLSGCACQGKKSVNGKGKCVASCFGALFDLRTCIYNIGIRLTIGMSGTGSFSYVDQSSSLFNKCRFFYSRYYSCLRKSWVNAGIITSGNDMEGIDMNSYSEIWKPLLPNRNWTIPQPPPAGSGSIGVPGVISIGIELVPKGLVIVITLLVLLVIL